MTALQVEVLQVRNGENCVSFVDSAVCSSIRPSCGCVSRQVSVKAQASYGFTDYTCLSRVRREGLEASTTNDESASETQTLTSKKVLHSSAPGAVTRTRRGSWGGGRSASS